ncbi:MAG: AAA family ATPase, partial [Betaproteobacteria bacterium]|nr:AAA family ATPase [Betaproteobacteria bacterium]
LILAATNRRDIVDPALLRPGRFDVVVEIPPPDKQARLAILRIQTRGKPVSQEVDLEAIAAGTEGRTGADLSAICHHAALNAIRERVGEGRGAEQEPSVARPLLIQPRHFETALNEALK